MPSKSHSPLDGSISENSGRHSPVLLTGQDGSPQNSHYANRIRRLRDVHRVWLIDASAGERLRTIRCTVEDLCNSSASSHQSERILRNLENLTDAAYDGDDDHDDNDDDSDDDSRHQNDVSREKSFDAEAPPADDAGKQVIFAISPSDDQHNNNEEFPPESIRTKAEQEQDLRTLADLLSRYNPSLVVKASGNSSREYLRRGSWNRQPPVASHEEKTALEQQCNRCGRTDTPMWRSGPNGPRTLCNVCGLVYAKKKSKQENRQYQAQVRK